jgi:hypothetical protein
VGREGCPRSANLSDTVLDVVQRKKCTGLQRVRDKLLADMQELNKNKPRGKADDVLLAEITRLDPALAVARDDLVRVMSA